MSIQLSVQNIYQQSVCVAAGEDFVSMMYKEEYKEGDRIVLSCTEGGFYEIMLEDTIQPTIVFIEKEAIFTIPFGMMNRIGYSPRSFDSVHHLITTRKANPGIVCARRNLALNPYDQHGETGMYPHAEASVETRGEALFAARNAIDGIFENSCHYPYPYQSWGINEDPSARLRVSFGVPVDLDEIILTLRADYPHDSYWTQAAILFSDGTKEIVHLEKTAARQSFCIRKNHIHWIELCEMVKADDPSPFPALTQIEAWGTVCDKQ